MINLETDLLILRFKQISGLKKDGEIAAALGISQSNYSNRKKRNTLQPLILQWAYDNNIDINWLVYGRSMESGRGSITAGKIKNTKNDAETKERSDNLKQYHKLIIDAQKITIDLLQDKIADLEKKLKALDNGHKHQIPIKT